MTNYKDLLDKIEAIKLENKDLINFKVTFTATTLLVRGEWFDNGKSEGFYNAGVAGYFYIPTDKGYLSTEWKKSELGKMKDIELTEELFNSLLPFMQEKSPNHFIRKTEGWGVAGVIANHINSKVDYTKG
tara:strand:- start:1240 stop:1629 length:390 start_codon:yes stop_codon:yes gene_type:complete